MKLVIVESIIGSILAFLGVTLYASCSQQCSQKILYLPDRKSCSEERPSRSLGTGFCFLTFFEVSFRTQGSILAPFKEGLWKRPCVSILIRCFKNQFFYKKMFLLLFFQLCGVLNTNIRSGLDLEPFWEARSWTVLYVNSFAKMFQKIPIKGIRYSAFLGPLWRGVWRLLSGNSRAAVWTEIHVPSSAI